jgi:hypothetical protein
MSDEILARIEERLKSHVERYERDRDEAMERIEKEQEHTTRWRAGFKDDLQAIDNRLKPIESDHKMIVTGGKWLAATVATGLAGVKGWFFLKDHLK